MGKQGINHSDISTFAQVKVNFPKVKVDEFSLQYKRSRERLVFYLNENSDLTLKKMLLPGSFANGKTLQPINDARQIDLCDQA
jgi:hypothetical protein